MYGLQTGLQQEYFYRKIGFGKNGHKGLSRKRESHPEPSSSVGKCYSNLTKQPKKAGFVSIHTDLEPRCQTKMSGLELEDFDFEK